MHIALYFLAACSIGVVATVYTYRTRRFGYTIVAAYLSAFGAGAFSGISLHHGEMHGGIVGLTLTLLLIVVMFESAAQLLKSGVDPAAV